MFVLINREAEWRCMAYNLNVFPGLLNMSVKAVMAKIKVVYKSRIKLLMIFWN